MRALVTGFLAVAFAAGASPRADAQSLAEIARKEEARRKSVQAGEKVKVYTNKDLDGLPLPPAPGDAQPAEAGAASPSTPAAEPPAAAAPGTAPAAGAGKDAAKPEADKPEPAKDQAYWSERMKALQAQLERDRLYADALQTRINSLTADFTARDDPAQRSVIGADRQRAIDELAKLKEQIDKDRKAIADLEEEARRARVPPGWLR